jgi:hypothetical protein
MSGLSSMIGDIVRNVIMECGSVHNFDGSEMIRNLNLEEMSISVSSNVSKKIVKEKIVKEKAVKEKAVKEKAVKEKAVKEKKLFPMPFNGLAKENCCSALRPNQGLYTQCEMVVSEPGFCKKCGPDAIYGTIEQRLAVGIMEFRDPKGKAPTSFTKIMKKLKISREDVEEEASKLNILINDIHFQEEETEKKEKGRPKKPRRQIELADDSTDLFAALVAKANESSEEEDNYNSSSSSAEESVKSVVDSAEEQEKEKVKQEKIQKKAEKLAETQKKEAEKAEKEAAKLAETQKKEAVKTKEPKKELATIPKNSRVAPEVPEKKVAKATKKAAKIVEEEEDEPDVVKRFEFEGVKYLKSKNTGIIYNLEQDVIGKWNEKTGKIDFEEAGSEEEEDEYDE